jgi:hypothetical protein
MDKELSMVDNIWDYGLGFLMDTWSIGLVLECWFDQHHKDSKNSNYDWDVLHFTQATQLQLEYVWSR